jgi:oxalate decarboxylase/phosphoglucose isomerase-like protein (cupin superfamily)
VAIAGQGRMDVFAAGENVRTKDFHAGDVGYIAR